jgi:putative acetyltransferase
MTTIRRATPKDAPAIGEIHMRAIRELSASHYSPAEIAAWANPRKPEFYLDSILNKEFYVAAEADVVVGFGTLNQQTREIEAVYVSPGVARRGIGSEILRALEERAQLLQLPDLYLKASLNAIQFYEQAGYEQKEETKHRLQSGAEISCVIMKKQLSINRDTEVTRPPFAPTGPE